MQNSGGGSRNMVDLCQLSRVRIMLIIPHGARIPYSYCGQILRIAPVFDKITTLSLPIN